MFAWTVLVFVGLCLLVKDVEGGECCLAHYGILTAAENKEMWCEDYCCFLTSYYCCNNILLRAPSSEREDLCPDYFAKNVWAPILISIGCLAAIIGCCVCCWCCCCRSNTRVGQTVVMAPDGANPGVTVVNTTNTVSNQHHAMPNMAADPYNAGYNQGPKATY
ncbi:uncharacterized protein [Argopecten irradians]|uniref:uncharacterized protein n=1 Tax=Argopecten irradians TaxID=31199 RepID=UPI0037133599